MAPTASPTLNPPVADVRPTQDDPACDVCPHPLAAHDEIGLRFCRATLTGAFTRGCICR
jgi:hypothetical protein